MRRDNRDPSAWLGYSVELRDESHDVRDMFDDVAAHDLIELIVFERIGNDTEVMNDIGMAAPV